MGAALGGGGGGGGHRWRGRRSRAPMSDINVTPLVDVMLVLLIVFMVSAPLLTVGVQVDLPTTRADNLPQNDKPIVVSIKSDGKLYVGDTEVTQGTLVSQLQRVAKSVSESRIYVRGDQAINYGKVMQTMGLIKSAGFTKVALIALPPAGK